MCRYLPLTGVLLAFWLGRETAADKPESPADLIGKSLELRAADGRIWLRAVQTPTGGSLSVIADDEDGNGEISIVAERSQKFVGIAEGHPFPRVTVGIGRGKPGVTVFGRGMRRVAELGAHPDGYGYAVTFAADGSIDWIKPDKTKLRSAAEEK